MIAELGHFSLVMALMMALIQAIFPLWGAQQGVGFWMAMAKAKERLKNSVKFCKDAYETAKDSDCLVIATEWNEFKELDFKKIKKLMKQPVIADGRNIYNPAEMKKLGFRYVGMGRG